MRLCVRMICVSFFEPSRSEPSKSGYDFLIRVICENLCPNPDQLGAVAGWQVRMLGGWKAERPGYGLRVARCGLRKVWRLGSWEAGR